MNAEWHLTHSVWLSSYPLGQEAITTEISSSCTPFLRGITCSNYLFPVFPFSYGLFIYSAHPITLLLFLVLSSLPHNLSASVKSVVTPL